MALCIILSILKLALIFYLLIGQLGRAYCTAEATFAGLHVISVITLSIADKPQTNLLLYAREETVISTSISITCIFFFTCLLSRWFFIIIKISRSCGLCLLPTSIFSGLIILSLAMTLVMFKAAETFFDASSMRFLIFGMLLLGKL